MSAQRGLDRGPLHFGVFDLNPATGELRKHGVRVRLQDQPLNLLLCLLETPGEICPREDLIRRIWPEGTFVDYERGLNVAVTRLRQVLGDSADTPRYVETVGRKGYRFIAPVEPVSAPESAPPAREGSNLSANGQAAPAVAVPAEVAHPPRLSGLRLYGALLIIGLMVGVAIGGATGWWRPNRPVPQPLVRLSIELGPEMTAEGLGTGTLLALSPDGTRLAVSVGGPNSKVRLATRRLDQTQLTPLAGTEGGASPFFSPDGQWIAFFAGGKLKKIPAEGGAPVTLCDADTHAAGRASMYYPTGSWGDDGNIIAALNPAVGLSRIPPTGGAPTLLTFKREPGEIYRWPQVLPGSQAVLFTASRGDYENGSIEAFSFKSGERRTIQRRYCGQVSAQWASRLPSPERAPGCALRCEGTKRVRGAATCPRRYGWKIRRLELRFFTKWQLGLLKPIARSPPLDLLARSHRQTLASAVPSRFLFQSAFFSRR